MDARKRYRDLATHALAGFQLVEASLKQYIGYYYDAVSALVDDRLSFSYSHSDIDEAALEKLLGIFSKVNGNKEFIKELRALINIRNEVAHRAFVDLYKPAQKTPDFEPKSDELIQIAEKLGAILAQMSEETTKVKSVLSMARKSKPE